MSYCCPSHGKGWSQPPCTTDYAAQRERFCFCMDCQDTQARDPSSANCIFPEFPDIWLPKHLVSILSPLVSRSNSHIQNSSDFASFIARQTHSSEMPLASFVSLYESPCWPCSIASERLKADSSLSEQTALSADQVVKLLQFCLDVTYVPSIQERVLQADIRRSHGLTSVGESGQPGHGKCRRESTVRIPVPNPFLEKVCGRHSDCLASRPDQSLPFTSNSFKTIIQFTVEEETDNILSFLDTKITHHEDGSLTTAAFHKNRHTERYLDFQWHHPLAHKVAMARTLLHWAERIFTDVTDRQKEKKHVAQALHNNS